MSGYQALVLPREYFDFVQMHHLTSMSLSSTPRGLTSHVSKSNWACSSCLRRPARQEKQDNVRRFPIWQARALQTDTRLDKSVPFRKQLKDEAKQRRVAENQALAKTQKTRTKTLDNWELTVGIEVHAQLNTERKLFSRWVYYHPFVSTRLMFLQELLLRLAIRQILRLRSLI